jgi:hypothetical protein
MMMNDLVFKVHLGEESYDLVYAVRQGDEVRYDVYEIPQYGGEMVFYQSHVSLDEAVAAAKLLI